jgi:DNA-directed RNA polymerase alpha subunit
MRRCQQANKFAGASFMPRKQNDQPKSDLPKLAQPAQRALAAAGIQRLAQLTQFSASEIKQLHGIGPNALTQLHQALASKGLTFADEKNRKRE